MFSKLNSQQPSAIPALLSWPLKIPTNGGGLQLKHERIFRFKSRSADRTRCAILCAIKPLVARQWDYRVGNAASLGGSKPARRHLSTNNQLPAGGARASGH